METEKGNVACYYSDFYSQMIGKDATGLLAKLWKYPHKLMEEPFKTNAGFKILELGAGEGEHIQFVQEDYLEYIALDIDSQRLSHIHSMSIRGVKTFCGDALLLNFPDETFDRVIATCLLAHLIAPESALLEWRRVLKPGGKLTIYIPCEPGLALKVFRNLFTKPKATKLGYGGYDLFIARDHVNAADRSCVLISHVFGKDRIKISFSPFKLKSWYINLFLVVQISKLDESVSPD